MEGRVQSTPDAEALLFVVTLERKWLLGTARAEREAFGRTIQYTSPDAWNAPSVLDGWRNRDIVAHLAASEVSAASVLGGEAPAEIEEFLKSAEGAPVDLESFNRWTVDRRANEPFRSVVTEWGRAADLLLARASKIPTDEWATRRVPWVTGEIRVPYLLQSRVMEWWLHGEDIGAGAQLPPRIEHPPIHCVCDLAIRMIPYALGLAGLSFSGRSVRVELEAAGGGEWHQGLAARDVPPAGKQPDTTIGGRAYAFALVAGRRVPAEQYLAEGTLQVGGDIELGETILTHLRSFAA
jgi:uncharacterized protein (TIGR03083 family)